MNRFPPLKIEGSLISADLIDQISDGSAPGQKPADFGLPRGHLSDEIAAAWSEARTYWLLFQSRADQLSERDTGTSLTRDRWLAPFFSLLGYELDYIPRAAIVEGKTYNLSHRLLPPSDNGGKPAGESEDYVPLHLVGFRQSLERRPERGTTRQAPHALMQEYLNRTEHLWGLIANGYTLRLLRNSLLMRRLSFIEVDLQEMMEGDRFADFALLYRLLHRTRLPNTVDDAPECLLETYHQQTIEQGGRVRDRLRDGVEEALKGIANGLIDHPNNEALREQLASNKLRAESFYQELLRLVYRLLFLMVAEERGLIGGNPAYLEHYSISRLRRLAEVRSAYNHQTDAWLGMQTTFELFRDEKLGELLGVTALNGDLFSHAYTRHLDNSVALSNRDFLTALWHLSMYREQARAPWRRINYGALDVEELGSVYESLLDFHPVLITDGAGIRFDLSFGSERKTTGSYYTPPELVQELIHSALEPVMEDRLKAVKDQDLEAREEALLSIKVCDPASGSGHFLLAAARRLGRELAKVRAGEDEPGPDAQRQAIREVIGHSIYAVDKNPLAVDLCKVALWIESHAEGKPLAFLDDRVRWGDSLVGVLEPEIMGQGIPDKAFDPLSGDDKSLARSVKARNKNERKGQISFQFEQETQKTDTFKSRQAIVDLPADTPDQVRRKAEAYQKFQSQGGEWWQAQTLYHLWTATFFQTYTKIGDTFITSDAVRRYQRTRTLDGQLVGKAWELALNPRNPFFHWHLEFPEVFDKGGFDVILCNPPWERIKLQEKEFFAIKDSDIATAPNAAVRKRMIKRLAQTNLQLWDEYLKALHSSEAQSQFLRHSGYYPLTGRGDINTYSVFTELFTHLLNSQGRLGAVIPTGIATDDTLKDFFQELMRKNSIKRFIGFENEEFLFSGIANVVRYCIVVIGGSNKSDFKPEFAFFIRRIDQLSERLRYFNLDFGDLKLMNPNTLTCPIFRTNVDASLTQEIYQRLPIIDNETTDENPWGISFLRMFDMTNDSALFESNPSQGYVRLYEAKMFWHFDHRFGAYDIEGKKKGGRGLPQVPLEYYQDPHYTVTPRYWIPLSAVESRLHNHDNNWLLCFRGITSAKLERTFVSSILPKVGVGNSAPVIGFKRKIEKKLIGCFYANLNSLVFDFIVRQKIGGSNMNFFVVKQLPVLAPEAYTNRDLDFIIPRLLELTYTAWDIQPFAKDMGYDGKPFSWDVEKRDVLRAELDAYFAQLFGLNRKQLRYVLEPADLTKEELEDILDPWEEIQNPLDGKSYVTRTEASTFPGETFRVLKEKELRKFGEYRTRRLVLEAWDRLEGMEIGLPSEPKVGAKVEQTREASGTQHENLKGKQYKPLLTQLGTPSVNQEEATQPGAPSTSSDFGLYKCLDCGKMVMGYEKDNHLVEMHGGGSVEWRKIR